MACSSLPCAARTRSNTVGQQQLLEATETLGKGKCYTSRTLVVPMWGYPPDRAGLRPVLEAHSFSVCANWPFWIAHNQEHCRSLAGDLPGRRRDRMGTARRPARIVAQAPGIQFKFGDGTAQGVAVHTQLACGLA